MGMLFNTPGTLRILAAVNGNLRGAAFTQLKANAAQYEAGWRALPTGGLYNVIAGPLQLDDVDPVVSRRWQRWLNVLDTSSQLIDGGLKALSFIVGNAMADAIVGKSTTRAPLTFNAIEFFAVPDVTMSVSVADLPESVVAGAPHTYTKIINVHTLTVDQLGVA